MTIIKRITKRLSDVVEDHGDIVKAIIEYSARNAYDTSPLVGLFALRTLIEELQTKTYPLEHIDLGMVNEILMDYVSMMESGEIDGAGRYIPSVVFEQAEYINDLKNRTEENSIEEGDI